MSKLLIVTEGVTDQVFFKALAKRMGLEQQIDVTERAGKSKELLDAFLQERLLGYHSRGFDRILLVRDCDGLGEKAARDSMQSSIERVQKKHSHLTKIFGYMRIDFLVIPNNLEDLLLSILKYPQINPCLDRFIECLKGCAITGIPKKETKTRFLAYLSSMKEPTDRLNEPFVYEQFIHLDHEQLTEMKAKIGAMLI